MTQNAESLRALIIDQAAAIEGQAAAIANGTLVGPLLGATKRILSNAETLVAWAEQIDGSEKQ